MDEIGESLMAHLSTLIPLASILCARLVDTTLRGAEEEKTASNEISMPPYHLC